MTDAAGRPRPLRRISARKALAAAYERSLTVYSAGGLIWGSLASREGRLSFFDKGVDRLFVIVGLVADRLEERTMA